MGTGWDKAAGVLYQQRAYVYFYFSGRNVGSKIFLIPGVTFVNKLLMKTYCCWRWHRLIRKQKYETRTASRGARAILLLHFHVDKCPNTIGREVTCPLNKLYNILKCNENLKHWVEISSKIVYFHEMRNKSNTPVTLAPFFKNQIFLVNSHWN